MSVEVADIAAGALDLAVYQLLRQRLTERVLVSAPAAGADWVQAVPADETWELLAVQFQLVTSAVVANRNPMLRLSDSSGNEVWRIGPQAVQAAGATNSYSYLPGFGYASGTGRQQMSLPAPPALLLSGESLGSVTSAIDVADQYSAIVVSVVRWSLNRVAQRVARIERTNWPL